MKSIKSLIITALIITTTGISIGCEEEETCFRCVFQERKTDGCDGYGYGNWEDKSYSYDTENIKDGWSKQDVCNAIKSDLVCEGGCCINYQVQNVQVASCN